MHGEYDKDVMVKTIFCTQTVVMISLNFEIYSQTGRHAQCLANQLQMYYTSSPGDRKFKILDAFTNSPNGFKHVDLINELTNISF